MVLERLKDANFAPLPCAPVLVLGHAGVLAAAMELLVQGREDLSVVTGQEEFLMEMARGWHIMQRFDPLVGHRHSQAETEPEHPWYGAERTDPKGMARALARGVGLHFGQDDRRLLLGVQSVFWDLTECRRLVDFVLGWDADARILVVAGQAEQAVETLADQRLWRLSAAENAIMATEAVFKEVQAAFGNRAMIWDLDGSEPDTLPEPVTAFIR